MRLFRPARVPARPAGNQLSLHRAGTAQSQRGASIRPVGGGQVVGATRLPARVLPYFGRLPPASDKLRAGWGSSVRGLPKLRWRLDIVLSTAKRNRVPAIRSANDQAAFAPPAESPPRRIYLHWQHEFAPEPGRAALAWDRARRLP